MSELSSEERYMQMIQKAWANPTFKNRLMQQPAAVLKEEGVAFPQGVRLNVVESTGTQVFAVLPMAEDTAKAAAAGAWNPDTTRQMTVADARKAIFKRAQIDPAFKTRLVSNAAEVFREAGFDVPRGIQVTVLENTSDCFNIPIPLPPAAELTDAQLERVVGGIFRAQREIIGLDQAGF